MRSLAICGRMAALLRIKMCATIDDMEPQGRISQKRGRSVEKESAMAWWSIKPTIRLVRLASACSSGVICFTSLWSTRHTGLKLPDESGLPAPGVSSNSGGSSIPASLSANLLASAAHQRVSTPSSTKRERRA